MAGKSLRLLRSLRFSNIKVRSRRFLSVASLWHDRSGMGATSAIWPAAFTAHNDQFHLDLLKFELVVDHAEELERASLRHMLATHLDSRALTRQLGVSFGKFAVEKKGSISVEPLLQFMQARIRAIPCSPRVHHQDDFICLRIVPDNINHANFV